MLNPVYRLAIDAQQRVQLGPVVGRAWRTTVVVPRAICVFEAVAAAGVAWHERAGFARLQALRLAPFASTQGSAALRGQTLMLWLWDADEVDAALVAGGLDPARTARIAEPLLLPLPATEGTTTLRCQGGTDHLRLAAGAIRESRWQPEAGSARAAPDLLRRPWSRDLLGQAGLAWDAATLQRGAAMACWAAAFASAAVLAYWGGQLRGLEQRLAAEEARSADTSTDLALMLRLRQGESADRAWIAQVRQLASSVQVEPLFASLRQVLEANNLAIRELELRQDDLRITLASGGTEIDLPRVLQALATLPGVGDVQLRQSNEPALAAFTLRVAGLRQPLATLETR